MRQIDSKIFIFPCAFNGDTSLQIRLHTLLELLGVRVNIQLKGLLAILNFLCWPLGNTIH